MSSKSQDSLPKTVKYFVLEKLVHLYDRRAFISPIIKNFLYRLILPPWER